MNKLIGGGRAVMVIFLIICIAVHVKGLVAPFSQEPVWSHIVHTISYTLCLVAMARTRPVSWWVYTMGAIYPFLYHARCVWEQYMLYHQYSAVCILVVVLLPLGILVVWPRKVKEAF